MRCENTHRPCRVAPGRGQGPTGSTARRARRVAPAAPAAARRRRPPPPALQICFFWFGGILAGSARRVFSSLDHLVNFQLQRTGQGGVGGLWGEARPAAMPPGWGALLLPCLFILAGYCGRCDAAWPAPCRALHNSTFRPPGASRSPPPPPPGRGGGGGGPGSGQVCGLRRVLLVAFTRRASCVPCTLGMHLHAPNLRFSEHSCMCATTTRARAVVARTLRPCRVAGLLEQAAASSPASRLHPAAHCAAPGRRDQTRREGNF